MRALAITRKEGKASLITKEISSPLLLTEYDVKIKWHASSLNYHDLMIAKGRIPVEDGRIPMSDGAGEIVAVGSTVQKWKVGDRVMSLFFVDWHQGLPDRISTRRISGESIDGYACEYSVLEENQITKVPKTYSDKEAASLPCAGLTAWRALVEEGKIQAGDTVLVEGTGGVSIFAIQIALSVGAEVYATTSCDLKKERLLELGVREVINYDKDQEWGKTIYNISGGVDHVLDVGGSTTIIQSIEAVKIYGNIFLIGILGGVSTKISFPKLFFKQIHLTGLAVGSADMQRAMVSFIDRHNWKPILDKTFRLDQLSEAFEYQESGKHFGKIMIEW